MSALHQHEDAAETETTTTRDKDTRERKAQTRTRTKTAEQKQQTAEQETAQQEPPTLQEFERLINTFTKDEAIEVAEPFRTNRCTKLRTKKEALSILSEQFQLPSLKNAKHGGVWRAVQGAIEEKKKEATSICGITFDLSTPKAVWMCYGGGEEHAATLIKWTTKNPIHPKTPYLGVIVHVEGEAEPRSQPYSLKVFRSIRVRDETEATEESKKD